MLRRLDSTEVRELQGADGAASIFWSHDGRSLAFFSDDKLKRMPLDGGPVEAVCPSPLGAGGCWSSSGVIVFQKGYSGVLHQVDAKGGESTLLENR